MLLRCGLLDCWIGSVHLLFFIQLSVLQIQKSLAVSLGGKASVRKGKHAHLLKGEAIPKIFCSHSCKDHSVCVLSLVSSCALLRDTASRISPALDQAEDTIFDLQLPFAFQFSVNSNAFSVKLSNQNYEAMNKYLPNK